MASLQKYLTEQIGLDGASQVNWETMNNLCTKKLWHQLSLELLSLVESEAFSQMSEQQSLKFYNEFVAKLSSKINAVTLANVAISCAQKVSDPNAAILFMQDVSQGFGKDQISPKLSVNLKVAEAKLVLQDYEGCKTILDENKDIVENSDDIPLTTHAAYFKTSADYNKARGEFSDFYRNSLRCLGCLEVQDMSIDQKQRFACDLALSALAAKDIYNFGELLNHPILETLKGTSYEWLYHLLYAVNRGDVASFEGLQTKWISIPELADNYASIKQKNLLMSLLEIIFRHPTNERVLKLEEFVKKLSITEDEVENLVMKALSLKLLRGTIDGVEKTITITWIQPRVLDFSQIGRMTTQLGLWCEKVENTLTFTKSEHSTELV